MRSPWIPLLLVAWMSAAGCAHGLAGRAVDVRPERIAFDTVRVKPGVDELTGLQGYDASDLFDQGLEALDQERYARAQALYGRLLDEFPDHRQAAPAQHNLALACQQAGDYVCAVEHYRAYVAAFDDQPERVVTVRITLAELLQNLGRYGASEVQAERVLSTPDVERPLRWEARMLRARAAAERGAWRFAEDELEAVRRELRGGDHTYHEAMLWYEAGELFRLCALRTRLGEDDSAELRAKAGLTREAFAHYRRALHYADPRWSGPAALAMGRLYEDLRADMVAAPRPHPMGDEERAVYDELLHQRTLPLLQGAATVYRWVLGQRDLLGLDDAWTRRIERALDRCQGELDAGFRASSQ